MNPRSYRILDKPVSTRVRCPVCHEEVYSRAGIHPQCAVRQSDPPRPKAGKLLPSSQAEPAAVTTAPVEPDALPVPPIVAGLPSPTPL